MDLRNQQIDPDVPESNGAFMVLPAGSYEAVIIKDDFVPNKQGSGKIWKITLQIIKGQFRGQELTDNINLLNQSAQCQKIGQGTLKRICTLCKSPFPPPNTTKLFGIPIKIDVGIQDFISNTNGKQLQSNKIMKYGPIDQSVPKIETTKAPEQW